MLTYPGQETVFTKLRAKLEEVWPTIHGWVEGFFWGVVGFIKSLFSSLFNVFMNR